MKKYRVLFTLPLVALGLGALHPARATGQTAPERPVNIVVMEDYPAFRSAPARANPRARELRAIVVRRDPVRGDTSTIILNPASLTAQTLADALRMLTVGAAAAPGAERPNFIAMSASRRGAPISPALEAALSGVLKELRELPRSSVPGILGMGQTLALGTPSGVLNGER